MSTKDLVLQICELAINNDKQALFELLQTGICIDVHYGLKTAYTIVMEKKQEEAMACLREFGARFELTLLQ